MNKLFVMISIAMSAALLTASCGAPAANNTAGNGNANKPANAANTTTAAPAGDNSAAQAEVKKLMDAAEVALAKNDADAMEKIYSDNYMLVNIDGSVQNRAERLASLRSGDTKYSSFSYSEPTFRFNADGTAVIVIAKLSMKGTSKGKPMDGDYRITQVYRKMPEGWKQITAQATKIEGGGVELPKSPSNTNTNTANANK
jgi:ketosteroid isomerase-like protein